MPEVSREAAWCQLSIRAAIRKGQELPQGWAEIAVGAVKELTGLRSHMPTAVDLCEGPGGVSVVGDGRISRERVINVPLGANVQHGRDPGGESRAERNRSQNRGQGKTAYHCRAGGRAGRKQALIMLKGMPTDKGKARTSNSIENYCSSLLTRTRTYRTPEVLCAPSTPWCGTRRGRSRKYGCLL